LLFKLSCGALGFLTAKRAICPFCHIYARALSPKNNILQANQAKINTFRAEFQELSKGALTCQVIVWGTLLFSRQMCIFGFFHQKKFEK